MMDQRVKAKWVTALESGEYPQTSGTLRRTASPIGLDSDSYHQPGYCCLGVLCELAAQEGICERDLREDEDEVECARYDGQTAFLPPSVVVWAGLSSGSPAVLLDDDEYVALTHLNDGRCLDFDQIAAVIREKL